ncbi:glycosyltransferase [Methyloglobulus sp.]|uniref:glycosyltransferase family 2 protein n=1 Tax=Methyloglobulus sp. TaxID=2518622 RepID=UPI0032B80C46
MKTTFSATIGAVVIGRNEGERLRTCLESLSQNLTHIVYVDSGSSDGSVDLATKMGMTVVPLDMAQPFTAARARNAGFKTLISSNPSLKYVQFIDGDCQLVSSWLESATDFLEQHTYYAVACGRRRERFPEKSLYNRLCDVEWDTPIGDATACGGDALIRVEAFVEVDGYREDLIAGEEPEMCFRLRHKGWKIYRLDAEMTWHDAAITQFGQWWRRSKRAGFAYAAGSALHGASKERYWVKENRSIVFWGGLLPILLLSLGLLNKWFMIGWGIYLVQIVRIASFNVRHNYAKNFQYLIAGSFVLIKFPQFMGVVSYHLARLLKYRATLIEYK